MKNLMLYQLFPHLLQHMHKNHVFVLQYQHHYVFFPNAIHNDLISNMVCPLAKATHYHHDYLHLYIFYVIKHIFYHYFLHNKILKHFLYHDLIHQFLIHLMFLDYYIKYLFHLIDLHY